MWKVKHVSIFLTHIGVGVLPSSLFSFFLFTIWKYSFYWFIFNPPDYHEENWSVTIKSVSPPPNRDWMATSTAVLGLCSPWEWMVNFQNCFRSMIFMTIFSTKEYPGCAKEYRLLFDQSRRQQQIKAAINGITYNILRTSNSIHWLIS